MAMALKRPPPMESLPDGRVTKRLRSLKMPLSSGSKAGQEDAQKWGIDTQDAKRDSESGSVPGCAGNSPSSFSSSDLGNPSEGSSDGEDETSSIQTDESPSSDSNESSEEEGLIHDLPLSRKPPISASTPASDLHTRIASFLPALRKANADLEDSGQVQNSRLDEVADDEEHYIEMDLGLGVLRQRRPATTEADGVKLADDSSTSCDDDDSHLDSTEAEDAADGQMINGTTLTHLLGGNQPPSKKPSIQVVTGS
jgi:Domain of unknown function (DUF4598)